MGIEGVDRECKEGLGRVWDFGFAIQVRVSCFGWFELADGYVPTANAMVLRSGG